MPNQIKLKGFIDPIEVIDDLNHQSLDPTGRDSTTGFEFIETHGERRLMARIAPSAEQLADAYGHRNTLEDVGLSIISLSNLEAAIRQKDEAESWLDNWQDFKPMDQDGLPICWTQGDCSGAQTLSRMAGQSAIELSGGSIAVPISGGNSGGWEGDTLKYMEKYGAADVSVCPNVTTSRSLVNSAEVQANRKLHMTLEALTLNYSRANNQRDLAVSTALLNNMPCPFAYNWMSHVMCFVRVVIIEAGSFGFLVRNSWGNWGSRNKYGFAGYQAYRWGKGTPDSVHCLRQVTLNKPS